MMKCKCFKCGTVDTYENHKSAWMDGWDFVGGLEYCGECSVMPTPVKNVKPSNKSEGLVIRE